MIGNSSERAVINSVWQRPTEQESPKTQALKARNPSAQTTDFALSGLGVREVFRLIGRCPVMFGRSIYCHDLTFS